MCSLLLMILLLLVADLLCIQTGSVARDPVEEAESLPSLAS
jgi:hypothetical protein